MRNKVEKGIIMAAGFGSRMIPVTYKMPKPLVKVNGISFIETIINKMLAVGIKEIYVVLGGFVNDKDDAVQNAKKFISERYSEFIQV